MKRPLLAALLGLLLLPASASADESLTLDASETARTDEAIPFGAYHVATVQGTGSFHRASVWRRPEKAVKDGMICGTPEPAPQFGSDAGPAGFDAETIFARVVSRKTCADEPSPRPTRRFEISLDGERWSHPTPLSGRHVTPRADHRYEYPLVGADQEIRFRVRDTPMSDNYGALKITVRPAQPADCARRQWRNFVPAFTSEAHCVAVLTPGSANPSGVGPLPPAGAGDSEVALAQRADLDGDGADEAVVLYDEGNGTASVRVFTNRWTEAWRGAWDWSRGKLVAGDFDGNGRDELAALYDRGATASVRVLSAGEWDERWRGPLDLTSSKLVAGDFNGDGRDDVAALSDTGGRGAALSVLRGTSGGLSDELQMRWISGLGNWEFKRTKLAAGDFDGDGRDDLAVVYDSNTAGSALNVFSGTPAGLANRWTQRWVSLPHYWEWWRGKLAAGDFDGDGDDDLAALYDYDFATSGVNVFPGTPTGLSGEWEQRYKSPLGWWEWWRSKLIAGDFDGDGRDDLAALYDYGSAAAGLNVFSGTPTGLAGAWTQRFKSGPGSWDWARSR